MRADGCRLRSERPARYSRPGTARRFAPHRGCQHPALAVGVASQAFELILGAPGLYIFVLELAGAVVATAYLNVIPNLTRSASPYAVIENVVVEESLRGTGLGKQIMAGTLRAAWDAGCYKAILMTGSRKPATHAFFRACGFSAEAKTGYVARPS